MSTAAIKKQAGHLTLPIMLKANLTKPRKCLIPEMSNETQSVTTQMKTLDVLSNSGIQVVAEHNSCLCHLGANYLNAVYFR